MAAEKIFQTSGNDLDYDDLQVVLKFMQIHTREEHARVVEAVHRYCEVDEE